MFKNAFRINRLSTTVLFILSVFAITVNAKSAQKEILSPESINPLFINASSYSNSPKILRNPFLEFSNTNAYVGNPFSSFACTTMQIQFGIPVMGSLTNTDCLVSTYYYDDYTFTGGQGQSITILMTSTAFDTFLELYNSAGVLLWDNDNGGGGVNSRIDYTLQAGGTYRIRATASRNTRFATGDYKLTLDRNLSISGRVFRGSVGLGGITVTLNGSQTRNTVTDPSGYYSFTELASGGTYTVAPSLAGRTFTPPSRSYSSMTTDQTNADFFINITLSGTSRNQNGNPLPGPQSFLKENAAAQAPLGNYLLDISCGERFFTAIGTPSYTVDVPQDFGNCTVTPRRNGVDSSGVTSWTPSSKTVSSSQNQTQVDFAASGPTFTIVGLIDPNASGVTVSSSLINTGSSQNCPFDANPVDGLLRRYTCGIVIYSDYRITPSKQGFDFNPQSRSYGTGTTNPTTGPYSGQNFSVITPPAISISNKSVTEGNSGTTPMNFTVSLSSASSQNVTVNYSTSGGTATAGQDYQTVTNGTVTIPAGSLSNTATVQVIGDTIVEPDETFTVTLSNPQGATIAAGQGSAAGTIINDDIGGSIQFSSSSYTVNEGDGNASVTVTRTGGAASNVTVICETVSGGTATANQDYTTVSRTLTFDANVTSQTCSIPILNDSTPEPNETVKLSLRNATGGGVLGSPINADLTILDDDSADVQITVQTNPAGRLFTIGGVNYSSRTFSAQPGTQFTVSFSPTQDGSTGTRFVFSNWSDGNNQSTRTITVPSSATTYTINFTTQHFLTVNSSSGGTVNLPNSWYNFGESVSLTAAPNSGFRFSGWTGTGSGSYTGSNNPAIVTMNAPITQTANFTAIAVRPVRFDFDGDKKADIAVYRPDAQTWFLRKPDASFSAVGFGVAADKPVPADYDGDGRADIAVWREDNSNPNGEAFYHILLSATGEYRSVQFGKTGDRPLIGDFNGDGRDDLAVYRKGTASSPLSYFYYRSLNQTGNGFVTEQWGLAADKAVPADFDGDGRTDIAIFRPSDGVWYVKQSSDGQLSATQFGAAEDTPVVGDFDGDGYADQAVFRPSNGVWYLNQSRDRFYAIQFGVASDKPAAADYDGDGKLNIAVYRPSNGVWYVLRDLSGSFYGIQFGVAADKPISNSFVP